MPYPGSSVRVAAVLATLLLPVSANGDLAVLQYHHVATDTPAATSTTPALFQDQLKRIAELGLRIVGLEEGTEQALAGEAGSTQAVALTFDDAYSSVYETAWPLLKNRGLPFTIFVNTDALNQRIPGYMTWAQLKELSESDLVSIGNHSSDHSHLVARPDESQSQLKARVSASLDEATASLRANLDHEPRLFAYPYGEYSHMAQSLVEERGWLGYGQHSGPVGAGSDPTALPRFPASDAYGKLEGLKDKLLSQAFPIDATDLPAPPISSNPPQLELELPANWKLQQLSCFAPGQGRVPAKAIADGTVEVKAEQPFNGRRWRYNCSYPAGAGRFYWLSQPWINPGRGES